MPVVLQDSTLAGNTAIGHAGDASGDTSGRQLDGFVVTFDRPVDPSGPAFDAQGRLLIGTDGGIWSGGEAPRIAAGTPLASVTDLVIDPFNPHSGDPGNWEVVVKVLNAETGSSGDGSVRAIPPAAEHPERESNLVYSGESGGMNESASQTGHFTQMVWADTHSSSGQLNPPWGLDRIDQRASDDGTGKVSVHDIAISKPCDAAGGASGDSFAFEPKESREPPGELPHVLIDDPAGDDDRRANTDGGTGDRNAAWIPDDWSGQAAESYGQQNKLQELRARAVADIDQFGPSRPEDGFVADSDAGTVPARQAILKMFSADYAGTGVADDSVHLPGTSDALAPTAFFLV